MAAFAAMLVTLLVVHTPIATVDRLLHETGHAHAANTFVGAVVDLPEHDQASVISAAEDDASPEPLTHGQNHHHHDGPSAYDLAGDLNLPFAWSSPAAPFRLDHDLRQGVDAPGRDRPPKALLAHVA